LRGHTEHQDSTQQQQQIISNSWTAHARVANMNRGFRGGDASAEPVAVLQAAIQQLAQRDQQANESAPAERARPEVPHFLPADYFQGAKQGYYFGTGYEGTGYVKQSG
jgi:citrate synthase